MTKKIFKSVFFVAAAVFVAAFVLITGVLYGYFSDMSKELLREQTDITALAVEDGGMDFLEKIGESDYRITLVSSTGKVLFDNVADSSTMENHLQREEIAQAIETGEGESARYSTTLMERSFYRAVKLSNGNILRLSISQYTWWTLLVGMLQPVAVIALFVLVMSMALAYSLSQNIVQPLNKLDLNSPNKDEIYEEMYPLVSKIQSQQKQLKAQETQLQQKKDEFEAATENLTEGLVLLNDHCEVLSINKAASQLLGVSSYAVGKNILLFTNSVELTNLLEKAISGEHSEMRFEVNDAEYQLNAGPVMSDGKVAGAALIMFDITEREKAEKMRREFTSNVSHELKTPLQTISGWAELLSDGLVKQEDVRKISSQIHAEARRLIDLVEDIIKLSHLDDGALDMKRESVDLAKVANEVLKELEPKAKQAQVEMIILADDVQVVGVERLLNMVIYNLCDNAIKYNKKGGEVNVKIYHDDINAYVVVRDNGIGIPQGETQRIFERFYRVDKSHSKEVGGTGLGLSIVKHSVRLHGGSIDVKSNLGEGTEITVTLPIGSSKSNSELS